MMGDPEWSKDLIALASQGGMVAVAWYCLVVVMPRAELTHQKMVDSLTAIHREERRELIAALSLRSEKFETLIVGFQACLDKLSARLDSLEQALRGKT